MAKTAQRFQSSRHDHELCIARALRDAETQCRLRGARLTELRRRVLEIIWQSHRPLGAYDILRTLSEERGSSAPPTVYRALEFLLENGLTHRIASLNAFVGCSAPGHSAPGQFLICSECGAVAELTDTAVEKAIGRSATAVGFTVQRHVVEIAGICPNCAA